MDKEKEMAALKQFIEEYDLWITANSAMSAPENEFECGYDAGYAHARRVWHKRIERFKKETGIDLELVR